MRMTAADNLRLSIAQLPPCMFTQAALLRTGAAPQQRIVQCGVPERGFPGSPSGFVTSLVLSVSLFPLNGSSSEEVLEYIETSVLLRSFYALEVSPSLLAIQTVSEVSLSGKGGQVSRSCCSQDGFCQEAGYRTDLCRRRSHAKHYLSGGVKLGLPGSADAINCIAGHDCVGAAAAEITVCEEPAAPP